MSVKEEHQLTVCLAKEQGIPLEFSDASEFDPYAHLEVEDNEEKENDDKE